MLNLNLDRYCVDASSFLKIFEDYRSTYQQILNGLDTLVGSNRLLTIRTVLEEVERNLNQRNLPLGVWLESHRDQILLPEDDQFWLAGIQVVHAYPEIFNPSLNRMQADPLLIGAAQIRRLILVTDEQRRTSRRRKSQNILHIPDVCGQLGIRCRNLAEMLRAEGILHQRQL